LDLAAIAIFDAVMFVIASGVVALSFVVGDFVVFSSG